MLPQDKSAALIQKVDGARLILLGKDGKLSEIP